MDTLLSRFSRVRLCATPQTAAHQAPPSMGFSRQEYWSGVPLPYYNLFIHKYTFGLYSPFSYCEQCFCEHSCTSIYLITYFQWVWYIFDKDLTASLLNFGKLLANLTEYRQFSYLGMYLKTLNFRALSTFFHETATSVPGKKHIVMENSAVHIY